MGIEGVKCVSNSTSSLHGLQLAHQLNKTGMSSVFVTNMLLFHVVGNSYVQPKPAQPLYAK